jgi:heterodisulfide reductase subunit A
MKRIGVFVCHCGINIAGVVDVKKVAAALSEYPGVQFSTDYMFMCSEPGQMLIRYAIKDHELDSVVVAACSPSLHEPTFRNLCQTAGLNPYQCEMANIREQCSWVHTDEPEMATLKAIRITKSMVKAVSLNQPLEPVKIPVNTKAVVIGGGIAGIQSALDIADCGHEVYLVERKPTIGGRMIQLSETFPTLDCSQCILTPKMVAVSRHPNVKILTYHEVLDISGFVGNFKVKLLKKPRYVKEGTCNLCNKCVEICPVIVPNEHEMGLAWRRAIYLPFPQAVPSTYCLDDKACLGLEPIRCGKCSTVCEAKAIDYNMRPEEFELEVGAVVLATGFDMYPMSKLGEYGGDKYEDVISGLEFERILSASGPTQGEVRRPSDGKVPKDVVFIQCAGSRDPENHMPYCSKICCMYTAKHAMLYKHRVHDGRAYVFYIDVRTPGKGFEEFYQRAVEEDRVNYVRGKVSKVFKEDGKLVVWGADTLTGKKVEVRSDMVVLALPVVHSEGARDLFQKIRISTDEHGFIQEAHPKLRPVEHVNSGFFLAGMSQGPKDIPETVAQASAAASKVAGLFSNRELLRDPTIAEVSERCDGCAYCVDPCPYKAITLVGYLRDGELKKKVEVNSALCQGCGVCMATCPKDGIEVRNLTPERFMAMAMAILDKSE